MMRNESRILARFTSLVLICCSVLSCCFIYQRARNPFPVPPITNEENVWQFDNPDALKNALSVEQYATLYNLDPATVRTLCASGAIRGAQTFQTKTRHWIIPSDAAATVSVADIATAHRVAERTVRDWIDTGRITPAPIKINREWRIAADYQLTPTDPIPPWNALSSPPRSPSSSLPLQDASHSAPRPKLPRID